MSVQPADGSEDVNDFLLRIRELGDRRDQEDEERNRKLEEEILQGRKERQARRAERARSISPTKSSPSNTPTTARVSVLQATSLSRTLSPQIEQDSQRDEVEARRDMANGDAMNQLAGSSNSPTKENSAPIDIERDIAGLKQVSSIKVSPSSAMPPSKNSPLSWQRRPTSQSSDRPRSRPLSMVATENAARSPRGIPEPSSTSATEPALSRGQIAQSLASKDPAWFRQTPDRGLNSPAYRKNQVEDVNRSDHGSNSSRVQMPGMARENSNSEQTVDEAAERTSSPSRDSDAFGSSSRSSHQSTPSFASVIGSPMLLSSAPRLDPPSLDSEVRMSPSQGRISPERLDRPASPTKGMGGFVQSAMMKRSDSVNKRWSVQSPPGLSRGNSVASNRSIQDSSSSLALGNIMKATAGISDPSGSSRDNSPLPLSRPTSSHSNATVTQDGRPGTASSMRSSITNSTTYDGFVKPSIPASRSQTPRGQQESSAEPSLRVETTPPTSPSKTMDSRRWSPTKSSWLESALNKPESPKPKAIAPPPQQPAWMSEINKAKQKGSVDLARNPPSGPKHAVNVGGLMRSPPPGGLAKPLSIGGLPAGFSSGMTPKPRTESISLQDDKVSPSKAELSDAASLSPTAFKSMPASIKVKPETPPRKDFRTTLKSRPLPTDNVGKDEPEFKNVFGQLRRTRTQNYVAPNELKDNITRGKAGLNITGGPKKTERKDEFKDAILKKKDDFKKSQLEGKGVTKSTSGGSQELAIPEALAKRNALGKPDSGASEPNPASLDSPPRQRTIRESPVPNLLSETSAPGRLQSKEGIGNKLAGRFNPALANLLARGPPSAASETSRSFSPANSQRTVSMSTSTTNAEIPEPVQGPQLTHMTKARARGPRRKAPTSAPSSTIASEENPEAKVTSAPSASVPKISTKQFNEKGDKKLDDAAKIEASSQANTENPQSQPPSPRKLDLKRRSQLMQDAPNKSNMGVPQLDSHKPLSPARKANSTELPLNVETPKPEKKVAPVIKLKPDTPTKSPTLGSKLYEQSPEQVDSPETAKLRPSPLSPKKVPVTEAIPKPSVTEPRTLNHSSPLEKSGDVKSVRNAAALWDRPGASQSPSDPPRARSPIKLPTHDDEKAAMIGAGLRSLSPVKDKTPLAARIESKSTRPLPTPPSKASSNPPNSLNDYVSNLPSRTKAPQLISPTKLTDPSAAQSETSRLLSDFFGSRSIVPEFTTNTAALLSTRPDQGQEIKTLRVSLYQLSGDGKKQLVPSHQERLLFEGNMYLCVHTYGNSAGKKIIETNWWIGDEVPEATAIGAEIFVQKEAKGNKMVKIQQGKEPSEFIQALGGIVIIRRGSSNKYDSLAPHILCGRKYLGQIAFDEVDFAPTSLCSGFPYLISTQSGKSYLWKGKGSGVDELSCARLIGMDFGLTGEIEEVEDGNEPVSFLKIFGNDAKVPKSADHWRKKQSYDKYCGRLFCADSSAKSQIKELSPFSQGDLSPTKIFVLDAFFEIYVIVGSRAQSQYDAFHNALVFAQEYGILAAGMEDRPMVPFSSVVLEGTPRDMKSVFRKWREGLAPTVTSSSLQRGRSLRVVPLTAALEATR
ncbi:p92 [Hyphodiscus hymeniophilus]|uniref:P92 n=1 Tax=Hyphodiscus hymeniophilus TaxID=353542 RepID=A0A9P7AV37_9HELO|nr:p92 [Hyphodiscus hymeniophilus]